MPRAWCASPAETQQTGAVHLRALTDKTAPGGRALGTCNLVGVLYGPAPGGSALQITYSTDYITIRDNSMSFKMPFNPK